MPWLEVETKVRISNVADLRKRIQKIAKLEKKEKRGDDYFAIKRKNNVYPKKAFRIRNAGKEHTVNFKKWLRHLWDKDLIVKEEFEFKIKTKYLKHFLSLLQDLGFEEWVKKRKTSESYLYKKDKRVIIEINKVEHLGYFMEIEYLAQPRELKKAKKIIRQVLKELGIKQKDIENTGYTKMLWDKGIKDKKYFMMKGKG